VPKLNGNPDFGSGQRNNDVKRYSPGVKLGILKALFEKECAFAL